MPVTFELTLDTRAPEVTWGAIAGTHAGELLRVAYTIDEPQIVAATLRLPDGRELVASALEDRIEVYLPPDIAPGLATLVAGVVDDVGNAADVELDILLSAALAIPTGAGRASHPTWSPTDVPDPPRVIEWVTSRAGARSRDLVTHVTTSLPVRLRIASSTAVTRRTITFRTSTSASSAAGVDVAHVTAPARAGTATSGRVVSRRDGRAIEEALLLGLL